jgi:very-short-patch-repair endonuclease
VDGGQPADSEADLRRTRWLEDQGFRILRFWNNEVLSNTGGVLDAIMVAATNLLSRHAASRRATLSHKGRGKNDSEF